LGKYLGGALLAITLCASTVYGGTENTQLVNDVVKESGLENCIKEQPGDLLALKSALLRAARVDGDAKGFMEAIRNTFLPAVAKIKNESQKNHQYLIIQYNLLFIAGKNGY